MGDDPEKHRLNADLPRHFEKPRAHFDAHPDITGAELFAEAERLAIEDGWLWGGQMAGHLVGEFPHYRIPGDKDLYRISPLNPSRMRDPDASGESESKLGRLLRASPPAGAELMEKTYPVSHSDAEWRALLTPEQYQVMRRHGTEAPGSCALLHEKRRGAFSCAGCGTPLFKSGRKFESGTGWPSFDDPLPGSVETSTDHSYGMVRTEVHCATCGSHLGHVFPDGPPPSHLRYCINGVAMDFKPE